MNVFFDRLSLMTIGWLPLEFLPHIQRIWHTVVFVCFCMLQLLQSVFQPLQLSCWKIHVFDAIDNCFHHVLADVIWTVHIIEIVVMLIFHKVVSEAFEYFD